MGDATYPHRGYNNIPFRNKNQRGRNLSNYRGVTRNYRDEPRNYRDEPRNYRDEPRNYRERYYEPRMRQSQEAERKTNNNNNNNNLIKRSDWVRNIVHAFYYFL